MMLILGVFLLFVSGDAQDLTPDCTVIPGKLRQISCGFGQVYGVNNANNVFYRMNNKWEQVPGQLLSVATGPGGTWGINPKYNIYRLQGSTWMQVTGSLLQLDSGGFQFLAGVTLDNKAVCLNQDDTLSGKSEVTFITYNLDLKYIACTQSVCWGVNSTNDVLLITGVQPYRCQGSGSQVVPGQKLYVITVSYDGSVFGLSPGGLIYRRIGITAAVPQGTAWGLVNVCGTFQSLCYDQGYLWLVHTNNAIYRCSVAGLIPCT